VISLLTNLYTSCFISVAHVTNAAMLLSIHLWSLTRWLRPVLRPPVLRMFK